MKTRYLNQQWDSPQWCNATQRIYSVVHHHPDNPEHRLENTLGAIFSLQSFYQILDSTSKANLLAMLDGTTKWWEHLLNDSELYDPTTHKWKRYDDSDPDDEGSGAGIMCLWLLGIVPDTGALYSPMHEFTYECYTCMDEYFSFDYINRVIRLPIYHGLIKFIYGSTPVSFNFVDDGVYDITFASDWNSITNTVKVTTLDPLKTYVREIGAPIQQLPTSMTLQLTKV
jgi:hypothetical protein